MVTNVVAVIVTYHPDFRTLEGLLDAITTQVAQIVIVDNGSSETVAAFFRTRDKATEHLLSLGENMGIATAQNVGIGQVRKIGAEHVLLFDQDSKPSPDMVSQLLSVLVSMAESGAKIAAVGPRYIDRRQDNPPPFIKVKGLKVERQLCHCPSTVAEVDYLIASGCIIPLSTLDKVGGMNDKLFIDYVDIEWGLRAKSLGFQSYGACAAIMEHDLGDEPIRFFGKSIPLHSPLRHYYLFRNAVWLYMQPSIALHWKLADGWRLILKYGFYSLFARPRWSHIRMMTLGIWHGLRKRMGPMTSRRSKQL